MNSLEKLIEDLKCEGFAIGKFKYDKGMTEAPNSVDYTLRVGHIELEELGLSTCLDIGIAINLPTEITDLNALASIKPEIRTYVLFKSFRADDGDFEDVEEKDYGNLASRLKEDNTLMQKLKDYFDSDILYLEGVGLPSPVPGLSFGKLYGQLVRQGGLRWFNLMEQNFPYVVTDSSTLMQIGIPQGGLYFVANDIANEPWKEAIAAIHESYCGRRGCGHEFAMTQEAKLAKFLGKEREHQLWREQIKNGPW